MYSAIDVEIEVAIAKKLLDAEVGFVSMNIRPVSYIELLVHGKAPLVIFHLDAAIVALGSQVVSVQRVAMRLFTDVLHLLDVVLENLSANDVLTEPASRT